MTSKLYDEFLSWMDWGSSSTENNKIFDEQAAMIEELHDEIDRVKLREKKLIQEYSQKIHLLNNRDTAAALETMSKKPFDEDMPADELSNKLRAEQRARLNEGIQSRRFLAEVKAKMEGILKDKMKEVLVLEKKVETLEKEKDSLIRQLEQKQSSKTTVIMSSTEADDSVIGTQYLVDQSFDTSSSLQQQQQKHSSPEISFENMSQALDNLLQGNKHAHNYLHLSEKEMQLFDVFKTLHTQVVQQKTMALQQKMDKVILTCKEKDIRIQESERQIQFLLSNSKIKDETITQSTLERKSFIHQITELEKQISILEEKRNGLQVEKETWIQNDMVEKEKNNHTILAMQRVLADVTMKKDRELVELKERLHRISGEERLMEPL